MTLFDTPRLRALKDPGAWTLIVVGLLLFLTRLPMPNNWVINLPLAVTIMQTAGLMFTLAGLQILVSKMVWPNISVMRLIDSVHTSRDPRSSSLVLLGLFVYNGLTTIALVIWVLYSLGLSSQAGSGG